ncbi:MAG: hypothetical protein VZR28_09635, partial [Candidatus Cryptobacteroides sp.]|nr:hypothetical protein [Candidatus Cryptobacteroides sp.]
LFFGAKGQGFLVSLSILNAGSEPNELSKLYGEKTSGDQHPERPSVVYDGLGLIPRLLSFPPLFIIFSSNLIYLLSANIG